MRYLQLALKCVLPALAVSTWQAGTREQIDGNRLFYFENAWRSLKPTLPPSFRDLRRFKVTVEIGRTEAKVGFVALKRVEPRVYETGGGISESGVDIFLILSRDGRVLRREIPQ